MKPESNRKTFYKILSNNLAATITNMFVWFALTFWAFLQTESVLVISFIAGTFAVTSMISALPFGTIVDHSAKKTAMLYSSIASLIMYSAGASIYFISDPIMFTDASSVTLWVLVITLMIGSVTGNLRHIALSTTVSFLFIEGKDKANGMVGMVNGVGLAVTSIFSGLTIGFFGFGFALLSALVVTFLSILHLFSIRLVEQKVTHTENNESVKKFDFRKTVAIIASIPGLFALIFFTTLNNFIGGVFMALLDAYGLSLMDVKAWGTMFAIVSLGVIFGSAYIARMGLGKKPLRSLFIANIVVWTTAILFPIQSSVILLGIGMLIWMTISPFIEASEQTILQAVVPYERQGRVFGFAQSIESLATPFTAFMIGPITQLAFIPFMTTGAGVLLIGDWFGVGPDRGMALVFMLAGVLGLAITVIGIKTKWYKILTDKYQQSVHSVRASY